MKRMSLRNIRRALETMTHELTVDPALADRARAAVEQIRHLSCSRLRAPSQARLCSRWFAMVMSARMRTVSDWTDEGYRGLRIPRCTSC